MRPDNIILIGMPASGKSTIGVILAKFIQYDFLDTDLLIQRQTGQSLAELIAEHGVDGFCRIENEICAAVNVRNTIIATGGSVVYGGEAMTHLRTIGKVVYLKTSLRDLRRRLGDLEKRGVALKDGMTLKDLYDERVPLYERYADVTVDETKRRREEIAQEIIHALQL